MIDVAYSRVLTTIDIRLSIYRWFYDGLRRKIYNFANDTVFLCLTFYLPTECARERCALEVNKTREQHNLVFGVT